MKLSAIKPVFVDFIPDRLEEGYIYICERFNIAIHKCCCGCGEEVATPLTSADWSVRKNGNTVSLSPSIGNWSFLCKSHYWIYKNRVLWAGTFTEKQIALVKAQDINDKEAYIAAVNMKKKKHSKPLSLITRLCRTFLMWLKS